MAFRGLRTFNTLASACSRGHAWLQASRLLSAAVENSLSWDLFSYNIAIQALLAALQHSSFWEDPIMIFQKALKHQGVYWVGLQDVASLIRCVGSLIVWVASLFV